MSEFIKRLKEEHLSCIIEVNGTIFTETRHGIVPILHFLDQGNLNHALVADRVIGKAAAMMMVYGGVRHVDTIIISEHALAFFKQHKIPVTYEELVPYIINRNNDGMCPMEETVLYEDDMEKACRMLKKKVAALQRTPQ